MKRGLVIASAPRKPLMIVKAQRRWISAPLLVIGALCGGACTFITHFDERDDGGGAEAGVEEDAGEPGLDVSVQPPVDSAIPGTDTGSPNPCALKAQGAQWGPKITQRCCRGEARDFETYTSDQDCNVCGFSCADGQRCVRSIQGVAFCIGCGNDNTKCESTTQCCSNERTGPNVFANPVDQGIGVCTASNCSSGCGDRCPPGSRCQTSSVTSFFCTY